MAKNKVIKSLDKLWDEVNQRNKVIEIRANIQAGHWTLIEYIAKIEAAYALLDKSIVAKDVIDAFDMALLALKDAQAVLESPDVDALLEWVGN